MNKTVEQQIKQTKRDLRWQLTSDDLDAEFFNETVKDLMELVDIKKERDAQKTQYIFFNE